MSIYIQDSSGVLRGSISTAGQKNPPTASSDTPSRQFFAGLEEENTSTFQQQHDLFKTRTTENPKSNRANSDYFEILAMKKVCEESSVPFNYDIHHEQAIKEIADAHGDDQDWQIKNQEQHLANLSPHLLETHKAQCALHGPAVTVEWTGKTGAGIERTVADFTVTHENGWVSGYSLKSVKSGTGTARNFGAESIQSLTGINMLRLKTRMDTSVLKRMTALDKERGSVLKKMTLEQRKESYTAAEKVVASEVGKEYAALCAAKIRRRWKYLPSAARNSFLSAAVAANETPGMDLFVAIAAGDIASIKPAPPAPSSRNVAVVPFDPTHPLMISFLHKGDRLFRLSFSCTNGLGISALCVRSFVS